MSYRVTGTRNGRLGWLVLAGVLLVGATAGYILAVGGPEGAAFIPGLLGGLAVLARPILGLLGVAFVMPFEDLLTFAGGATATKALAAMVSGAWVLWKLARGDSWQRVLRSPLVIAAILFLGYALGSTLWSTDAGQLPVGVIRVGMVMGLGVLTADLVREWEHAERLAQVLVLGGLIAAAVTIQQYFFGGARRAGEGIVGGVNATAFLLLTILPFGFLLLKRGRALVWRMMGLAYLLLAILSVTLTFSRMTLMVLPLVLVLEFWELVRSARHRLPILAGTLAVALLLVQLLPADKIQERLATVGPYITSIVEYGDEGGSTEIAGRGYHIMVALAIFRDNPIIGAGYGSYGELFLEYQHDVPGAGRLYGSERSPHGNYWGFLADLGLVGTALWMGVLFLAFRNVRRAWKILSQDRDGFAFLFTRAVGVMMLIHVLYGAYAQMHLEKMHWIVLGLSVAVRLMAEARSNSATQVDGKHESTIGAARQHRDVTTPAEPVAG